MDKTVFVIGAGASKEAGLPTGEELKSEICNLLDISFDFAQQKSGDYLIADTLRDIVRTDDGRSGDIDPYLHQARHISKALPLAISIDNFIDSQRENKKIELLGKLAIIRAILKAEKESKLYYKKDRVDSSIDLNLLHDTWYLPFFQLITENCEVSDLEDRFQSIALIIFNYDRCVEHFLIHALQKYYPVNESEAADLISRISIYHPYGSVGNLPSIGGGQTIEFGAEPRKDQLLKLTSVIKTFTESADPESSEILAIKEHMNVASKLVFMGFAFHKINMSLIAPINTASKSKALHCYCSTFGISNSDEIVIIEQIKKMYKRNIPVHTAPVTSFNLFKEYWRSLAF